jgi:ribosome biogenesis protein ENP2
MASALTGGGAAVYPLAAGKSLPQWLSEAKKRALKKDEEFRRRIELIQDFAFPSACSTLALSGDGRYIVATGTYPPRVRVYDTAERSLKFERYMDAAPVAAAVLGDDFTKLAFLQDDRHVEVHAGYGRHHRTRIPTFGRDLAWHAPTAELLVGAGGGDVYRLSLEEGRYMAPLATGTPGVNALAVSRITALVGAGCDGGAVQVWDPRDYSAGPAAKLAVATATGAPDVTALAFDERSLTLAVGTADGHALLYDLRSSKPLADKAHGYRLPVTKVAFHRGTPGGDVVLSADAKVVKLWRRAGGQENLATIEAPAPIRAVAVVSDAPGVGGTDSGLLLVGCDAERIAPYYVPALGLAPRWASYLDTLTEELEEGASAAAMLGGSAAGGAGGAGGAATVYDDYRFVTRDELAGLGLGHLVGTPLLRGYMHGYFMDARLHARVTSLLASKKGGKGAGGAAQEEDAWRRERVRAAVAQAAGSRVTRTDALPAVNRELAARLLAASGGGGAVAAAEAAAAPKASRKRPAPAEAATAAAAAAAPSSSSSSAAGAAAPAAAAAGGGKAPAAKQPGLLRDGRFSALFSNPDFAIDEASEEYSRLHPTQKAAASGKSKKRRDADSDAEDDDDDA